MNARRESLRITDGKERTMCVIPEMLSRGVEHLVGRFSGPLNFRLFIMPTVVTVIAIRAGLKDARHGKTPYLRQIFHSGVKDVGRIFIVAVVLDTGYQLFVLRGFYPGQVIIVAVACAIVPYLLVRGPVTRIARGFYKQKVDRGKASADTGSTTPADAEPIGASRRSR